MPSYSKPTAAELFAIGENNTLYVTLYDKHVAFKMARWSPNGAHILGCNPVIACSENPDKQDIPAVLGVRNITSCHWKRCFYPLEKNTSPHRKEYLC